MTNKHKRKYGNTKINKINYKVSIWQILLNYQYQMIAPGTVWKSLPAASLEKDCDSKENLILLKDFQEKKP